ncbi:MAG: AAA family ATPase [Firmicutes bacterium]|nr:AAA family ATPase [Bacillota bacterium]
MKDKDLKEITDQVNSINKLLDDIGRDFNFSREFNQQIINDTIYDMTGVKPESTEGMNAADIMNVAGLSPGAAKSQTADAPKEAQASEESAEAEEEDPRTLEELLSEMDELVGLTTVKEDVRTLINFLKVSKLREEEGLAKATMSNHLVFTGNPGTGKTTIARMLAGIYKKMGLLSKGQLIEADRSSLVAGYSGQTAIKTQEVIQSALGGVLFIDEAYALNNDEQDAFGRESIETILKGMEDHRDDLVVIVAGYTDLMHKFIDSNPGLSSRFGKYFEFPDYTGDEMSSLFSIFCKKNGYVMDEDLSGYLSGEFDRLHEEKAENFGNARTVRNVFEKSIANHANRIAALENPAKHDLELLTKADIEAAIAAEAAKL